MITKKIILIFFIIIILIIIILIMFFFHNTAFLKINFNPTEVNLKINGKKYSNIKIFEEKIRSSKCEIEVSKENYETYKNVISIKPKTKTVLYIKLKIDPALEKEVKKIIGDDPKHEINIVRIKNNYIEAIKKPVLEKTESTIFILKKINNKWEILSSGTGIDIEMIIKEGLLKTLPYKEAGFEVSYIDTEDTFIVIIKKQPTKDTIEKAKEWFKEQSLDPKSISISWTTE